MPVLFYGSETIGLHRQNYNELRRIENNLIRSIFGISKRCKMTNFKLIINLNDTVDRLKYTQISFFERLLSNSFTKTIIKDQLIINNDNDYMSDIMRILNEVCQDSNMEIIERCKTFKQVLNMEHKTRKKNNPVYDELQRIFNESNGDRMLVYNLLRYDNPIFK